MKDDAPKIDGKPEMYLFEIEYYGSDHKLKFKVDWKTGIELALQASKQFNKKYTRGISIQGVIHHGDMYFDLFNEAAIKLRNIKKI